MERSNLTLVLVTQGSPRLAAPLLAERFARVRCEAGSVLIPISRRETPEGVLAYCRERSIGVIASCVVSRTTSPHPPVAQEVAA